MAGPVVVEAKLTNANYQRYGAAVQQTVQVTLLSSHNLHTNASELNNIVCHHL